jgi:hypothetical protein
LWAFTQRFFLIAWFVVMVIYIREKILFLILKQIKSVEIILKEHLIQNPCE